MQTRLAPAFEEKPESLPKVQAHELELEITLANIKQQNQIQERIMNTKTLAAITRHGESLLKAFPNATERDPVALCKKLRRIETSLTKPLTDACNGDFEDGENGTKLDAVCDKANHRACELLFGKCSDTTRSIVLINRDPRGHALKLDDEWTRKHNNDLWVGLKAFPSGGKHSTRLQIQTDMGGYGILAPDLNT